jgi:hypothetical protein
MWDFLEMWVIQPKVTKKYKQRMEEIKFKAGTNETITERIVSQKLKPKWLLFNVIGIWALSASW